MRRQTTHTARKAKRVHGERHEHKEKITYTRVIMMHVQIAQCAARARSQSHDTTSNKTTECHARTYTARTPPPRHRNSPNEQGSVADAFSIAEHDVGPMKQVRVPTRAWRAPNALALTSQFALHRHVYSVEARLILLYHACNTIICKMRAQAGRRYELGRKRAPHTRGGATSPMSTIFGAPPRAYAHSKRRATLQRAVLLLG